MPGQERAESAILSLIALVKGNYEATPCLSGIIVRLLMAVTGKMKAYTAPQKPAARLTPGQWQHLQSVVAWAAPDRERLGLDDLLSQ